MAAPSALFVVPGGDHGLLVGARERARVGRTQADFDEEALAAIGRFLAPLVSVARGPA
jgi:hypothetical protein